MDGVHNVMEPDTRSGVLAARKSFGFTELPSFGWLCLSGPDTFRFMQNRTSNDVLALRDGQGHINTVLDRNAKIQGLFSLHRQGDALWMLVEREQIPHLVAEIEKYHIVEQFSITDQSDDVRFFTLQGPQSTELLSKIFPDIDVSGLNENDVCSINFPDSDLFLIKRSLIGQPGYVVVVPTEVGGAFEQTFRQAVQATESAVALTPEILDTLRIEAGWPKLYTDLDTGTLLPGTGLETVAVSYSKGCYLGQETVARVKTYGAPQRALVGLLFEEGGAVDLPPVNTPLLQEGKEFGVLKSGTFSPTLNRTIAMAFLGKEERVPGRILQFTAGNQAYQAEVTTLPFYRPGSAQDEARLLMEKGLHQFAEGQDEAAIALLQQAIDLDETRVEAYESLGVILSRHERIDEAMALMEKVLELDPEHVMAHTNLSIYWLKKGDKDKAEEEKAKATVAGMRKKAKEAGLNVDLDAERRKKEQATRERAAMFEEALKLNPDDPLGNFGLGTAYLELQEYGKAIPAFEKVIAAQPKHSVAYLSLGKALEGSQQSARAVGIYRRGVEVAAAKGDLMPLNDMQDRLRVLSP